MRSSRRALAVRALAACCLAVLFVPTTAHAATEFKKGPYLQSLSATGVIVKLELGADAPVSISVTDTTTKAVVTASDTVAQRFHAVRVTGLSPATSYEYKATAGEGGDAKTELGHFTTAPTDDRPIHFIVYGDSRSDDASHEAVVKRMLERPADFLVATGDMVARGTDEHEWTSVFNIERELLRDRCVFACIGNHELVGGREGEVAYLRYFAPDEGGEGGTGHLYGTMRWGNTRFFLLNAMDEWRGDERAWFDSVLTQAMDEPGLRHRIAVLHHGPFSSGPHRGNPRLGSVVALMRDKKVDLLLAGHDHIYERGEGAGIKYIISGGAGAPLYERETRAPETMSFESEHHFVEVTIEGDKIETVARRASGSLIESCEFTTGKPWTCQDAPASASSAAAKPTSTSERSGRGCSCEASGESGGGLAALGLVAAAAALRRRRAVAR